LFCSSFVVDSSSMNQGKIKRREPAWGNHIWKRRWVLMGCLRPTEKCPETHGKDTLSVTSSYPIDCQHRRACCTLRLYKGNLFLSHLIYIYTYMYIYRYADNQNVSILCTDPTKLREIREFLKYSSTCGLY
jgi:hypothetical protein